MLFDLTSLFSGQADSLPFQFSIDLSELSFHAGYPFSSPVQVSGTAVHAAGEVTLSLDVSCQLDVPCDRCAELTHPHFRFSFVHPVLPPSQSESDDINAVPADANSSVDLAEVARADLLLELPSKFLCSPDCKGLCPQCGVNRNVESCTCSTHSVDPRLEILKNLIDH